jgi:excisionase family DNA binding protein
MDEPTTTTTTATTTPDESPWLTAREAAARAKCSTKFLYASIRGGKLRAVRLGVRNDIRVHVTWLDAWIASATLINPNAPGDDITPPLAFATTRHTKTR